MQTYITQLLADIADAAENIRWPFVERELDLHDWLPPDEEDRTASGRARELEIEIQHLKQKYGDDWEKYYPYHLDPNYDDDPENRDDFLFGDDEDEGG